MAASALVRILFQDQGAGRGLDEVNARLRRMEYVGGPGARRGLRLVENGMRSLAFQAVGLRGGLGQLTEAFLQIGGGKGAALLAAAGVGAVVGAARIATATTRELAKENERLAKSYREVVAQGRPWVNLQADIASARGELVGATGRRERLERTYEPRSFTEAYSPGRLWRLLTTAPGDIEAARAAETTAQNRLNALKRAGESARTELVQGDRERRKREAASAEAIKSSVGDIRDFTLQPLAITARLAARMVSTTAGTTGQVRAPRRLNEAPEELGRIPGLREALPGLLSGVGDLAFSTAAGGIGGAVNWAGGIVSSGISHGGRTILGANPILGAGLSLAGGLFSMFDRSEERRHRELIDAITKQGREAGLQRVSIVLPNGQRLNLSELVSAETHDAVARVPGFAGTTG